MVKLKTKKNIFTNVHKSLEDLICSTSLQVVGFSY